MCSLFFYFLECGLILSTSFQNVISSKPRLVPRMWSACAKILVFATYPFVPQSSSKVEASHHHDDNHPKFLGHVFLNPLLRRLPIPSFRRTLTIPKYTQVHPTTTEASRRTPPTDSNNKKEVHAEYCTSSSVSRSLSLALTRSLSPLRSLSL